MDIMQESNARSHQAGIGAPVISPSECAHPPAAAAVQLTPAAWTQVADLIGDFPPGMRGTYIDADGNLDADPWTSREIGLLVPAAEGTLLARTGDWIVRDDQGSIYICPVDHTSDDHTDAT